jgi:hypothetical protein
MEKRRKLIAISGLVLNLIFGTFMVLFAVRHPHWETLSLTPDARIAYYEKLLHIVCDKAFPWTAGSCFFSAILFWMARK